MKKHRRGEDSSVQSRRNLLKCISILPLAVISGNQTEAARAATAKDDYKPSFFNADEWAFVIAACNRLIPHDETGPGAVESGVPEFLDRHMQTPYASGALWYMQGPFREAAPEFGYQGRLVLRDMLRAGMKETDGYCRHNHGGKSFSQLAAADQDNILKGLEKGDIHLETITARYFFSQLLAEVKAGYFADPKYGGNHGMGAWKMIGYPGVRADYSDWVEVRDRPYPLPPVDLSGRRG